MALGEMGLDRHFWLAIRRVGDREWAHSENRRMSGNGYENVGVEDPCQLETSGSGFCQEP